MSNSEWYNPLVGYVDLYLCTPRNTSWTYDKNMIARREVIDKRLEEFAATVERQRAIMLQRLSRYFSEMNSH
ncbi:hypothetical protein ANCCAN_15446 [Ancylostoma caninum]|uniref:Uncharacterized protein n=1 Tax=Ancylostoma caninum TaxID=29170 RepID=A0A368G7J2_ANCCA|nr:hypothetical protein ANCCAN_15446 [Ancylostoma caninum]